MSIARQIELKYERQFLQVLRKTQRDVLKTLEFTARQLSREVWQASRIGDLSKVARKKKLLEQTQETLNHYFNKTEQLITGSATDVWAIDNNKWTAIIDDAARGVQVLPGLMDSMTQLNLGALDQFLKRKAGGLNLSDRIWALTAQNQDLIELYVGSGIAAGRSAVDISKDMQQLLVEPDKLVSRVRDENGDLVLSEPAKEYHSGQGRYRSSYKNALRLAATETNMAYRSADFARRNQLDFVYGITVHLSGQHPRYDICDPLAGDYPKTFKFIGWHPLCICFTTAKIPTKAEMRKFLKTGKADKRRIITAIPRSATAYAKSHAPIYANYKSVPYWFNDNFTKTGDLRANI